MYRLCTADYLTWSSKTEPYSVHGVYSFISKRLLETLETTPFVYSLRKLCSLPHSCTSSETHQSSEFRCKEKNLYKNMILFVMMLPFKIPESSDLTNLFCLCNKRLLSFYKNSFLFLHENQNASRTWLRKCASTSTQPRGMMHWLQMAALHIYQMVTFIRQRLISAITEL